jgi:hypothetical protein
MIGTNLDEGLFPLPRRTAFSCQHRDDLHPAGLPDRRYFDMAECKCYPVSAWP